MDIRSLMQEMHDAPNEEAKEIIDEKIKSQFAALSDLEKEKVRQEFNAAWDEELEYARKKLIEIDRKIEMLESTSRKIA